MRAENGSSGRHAGTVAIVTGAGIGIGRAIVRQLAAEGGAVGVVDIDASAGQQVVDELAATGARAAFAAADITDFGAVEAAFAAIAAALGPVTLLVNNAAYTDAGSLETISLESWHREIDINLNGTYHCIRALLPALKAEGSGAIVNIASVNAKRYFGNPSYSAAKAGIISLTKAVASEYGAAGIRCNAVCPGSVRTEAHSWQIRQQRDPDVFRKLARWYPLGRVAEPADIAEAVLFLGSPAAAYITGAVLDVDGGLLSGMNVMIEDFVLE
jgi:NAD(P)-dependent dehydrogenase (short-subunit alcohol dehydrogenase family)